MAVNFRVNGEPVSVNVPPEMPLLWVLRDVLELKGTKFGCGIAQCGACTVHMDGQAIRSCSTPVSRAEGSDVRTVEGLSPDGSHALQQAWKELDVPQCGYCQAGQLMSAAALLEESPRPTDDDIDRAMDGNLCRCATYLRIREAIHRAADTLAAEDAGGGGLDDRSGDRRDDRPGDPSGDHLRDHSGGRPHGHLASRSSARTGTPSDTSPGNRSENGASPPPSPARSPRTATPDREAR